jgi:CubicO group peptidase (beta-lactamase class C family)
MGKGEGAGPVEELASQAGATAVVVCDHGKELLCAGQPSVTVHCRSIRKTLLGALFGRHVASGTIDLDTTLADLGIDDSVPPSLTSTERSARVRDLLTCRSGIYHPSNHQGEAARAALPPRGAHGPGIHFLYNNWDFNALGTIFERAIGRSMFTEFADTIAGPSGMRDFDPDSQRYATQGWSEHRTYAFHISARDLARFGQLYLNHGEYDGHRVIPAGWVTASTRPRTSTGRGPAYGYLWWTEHHGRLFTGTTVPPGSFAAYGMGGQFLLVMPVIDRVMALLADPQRPSGTDRAAHRPALAKLVRYATDGAVPLAPDIDLPRPLISVRKKGPVMPGRPATGKQPDQLLTAVGRVGLEPTANGL